MNECQSCFNVSLVQDPTLGHVFCTVCGSLSTESIIVPTLTFLPSNTLSGQLISLSTPTVCLSSIANHLDALCVATTLPLSFSAMAFRWYKLSLAHNLTKGKKIHYTLAACLYLVCRLEKTPHFIVDFGTCLRIDSTRIGRCYLAMVKALKVKAGHVDPSLFMHRYQRQLGLNCVELANRVVKWMKRDWIVTGRRPNNVCGAAILVASRMVAHEMAVEKIAKVTNCSVQSILKRVQEIRNTETASMSVDEFMHVWISKEEDPPSKKNEKINIILEEEEHEWDLSNDEEIDECILSPEESRKKAQMWDEMYGEYMKEKESKVVLKKVKKKKEKIVEKKKSSKINYSVLDHFFHS